MSIDVGAGGMPGQSMGAAAATIGGNPLMEVSNRVCQMGERFERSARYLEDTVKDMESSTATTRGSLKVQHRQMLRATLKLQADARESVAVQRLMLQGFIDLRGDLVGMGALTIEVSKALGEIAGMRADLAEVAAQLKDQAAVPPGHYRVG
jgi:hypothetical protein